MIGNYIASSPFTRVSCSSSIAPCNTHFDRHKVILKLTYQFCRTGVHREQERVASHSPPFSSSLFVTNDATYVTLPYMPQSLSGSIRVRHAPLPQRFMGTHMDLHSENETFATRVQSRTGLLSRSTHNVTTRIGCDQ